MREDGEKRAERKRDRTVMLMEERVDVNGAQIIMCPHGTDYDHTDNNEISGTGG